MSTVSVRVKPELKGTGGSILIVSYRQYFRLMFNSDYVLKIVVISIFKSLK